MQKVYIAQKQYDLMRGKTHFLVFGLFALAFIFVLLPSTSALVCGSGNYHCVDSDGKEWCTSAPCDSFNPPMDDFSKTCFTDCDCSQGWNCESFKCKVSPEYPASDVCHYADTCISRGKTKIVNDKSVTCLSNGNIDVRDARTENVCESNEVYREDLGAECKIVCGANEVEIGAGEDYCALNTLAKKCCVPTSGEKTCAEHLAGLATGTKGHICTPDKCTSVPIISSDLGSSCCASICRGQKDPTRGLYGCENDDDCTDPDYPYCRYAPDTGGGLCAMDLESSGGVGFAPACWVNNPFGGGCIVPNLSASFSGAFNTIKWGVFVVLGILVLFLIRPFIQIIASFVRR